MKKKERTKKIKKARQYNKGIIIFLLIALMVFAPACGIVANNEASNVNNKSGRDESIIDVNSDEKKQSDTNVCIFFDQYVLDLCGEDKDGMIDYLKELGDGHFVKMWSDEENGVYLEINENQREFWERAIEEKLEECVYAIQEISSLYDCVFLEDYTVMNLYYDLYYSVEDAMDLIGYSSALCTIYQVIEGNNDHKLSVYIYNKDTGNLVTGGNIENDGVYYNKDDWDESYRLSGEEGKKLLKEKEDDSISAYYMKPAFLNSISAIDILFQINANDYSYLYINENDEIVMGMTEDEKQHCLEKCEKFLTILSQQFSDLGSGYCIDCAKDFSVIDIYFDNKLSDQDQIDYIGYTEECCMILQILNEYDYYIDINIYNSQTGELVSSGNTIEGISWKMD